MDVMPFEVRVTEEVLDDLRERLARTRWPDEVAGAGWDYGTNLAYLRELVGSWEAGFDLPTSARRSTASGCTSSTSVAGESTPCP
jgi:hypothetical protein